MLLNPRINILSALLFGICGVFVGCSGNVQTVVVKPVETDSFLLNPGRGFTSTSSMYNETFGDRLHPKCGVSQQRFFWDKLEPEEGKINYALIDSAIVKAVKNGQRVNFRVMCQDVEMMVPRWALQAGVKSPFYDNPVFIEKQINLIKALGAKYDGNPGVCFVDIGTIGQWGEWHIDPDAKDPSKIIFPSDENARRIIDAYLQNFTKTPLMALIAFKQKYGFGYATSKGTGWRADCWGDMDSLGWNHMKGVYPQALQAGNAFDSWKKGPVALETCWTIDEWFKRGWDIDYILGKALEWHATEVNNGNQAIPEKWYARIQAFEKRLGYRYVLTEVTYPSAVKKGMSLQCAMSWQNKGVAPVYNPYDLAVQLVSKKDSGKKYTLAVDQDIRKWMPGATAFKSSIAVPEQAEAGDYEMQVGIVSPDTNIPAIQLAVAGKNRDGWYPLGGITITD